MRQRLLTALPVPAGPAVLRLLPRLAAALEGGGEALLPYAAEAPGAGPHPSLCADQPLAADEDCVEDPTAFVVSTSGSTGLPKGALLPVSALRASAAATERLLGERPGSPAQWVLALPAQHIAGLQVLLRSVRAGTEPVVLDLRVGFTPENFLAATDATTAAERLTSLVPTQLRRLLQADAEVVAALASYRAVLVGAAATPPALQAEARAAGVRLVTTYGSSETSGGCVYNGRPFPGVRAEVDAEGRLSLTGEVVARGYRGRPGDPAFQVDWGDGDRGDGDRGDGDRGDRDETGRRTFHTDDSAVLHADGSLSVTGRLDEMITTGGLKVAPQVVEAVLAEDPRIAEVSVLGVPDEQWGQRVVACLVLRRGAQAPSLAEIRALVTDRVTGYAAPREVLLLSGLPLRGPGKPDRHRLRELVADQAQPR